MTEVPVDGVPAPEPPAPVAESDVKNAFKGAVRSAIFVFAALMIPAIFQFLNGLMSWANDKGGSPFPDLNALGWVAASAVISAITALLTFLVRWAENHWGVGLLRSSIPVQR